MGDGEDGPTHQPVEQLISLRAIPGLVVLRPGDANEVVEAYRYILQLRHQPAVLALSRQPLPTFDRTQIRLGGRRGAWRLRHGRRPGRPARDHSHRLGQRGCVDRRGPRGAGGEGHPFARGFDAVLGHLRAPAASLSRAGAAPVDDGAHSPWSRRRPWDGSAMSGDNGRVIGMKTFGASAPLKELQRKFGFEPDKSSRPPGAAWRMLGRDVNATRQDRKPCRRWLIRSDCAARAREEGRDRGRRAALRHGDLRRPRRSDQAPGRAGALQSGDRQAPARRLSPRRRRPDSDTVEEWRTEPDRHDERIRRQPWRRVPGRQYRSGCLAVADRSHELSAGRSHRTADLQPSRRASGRARQDGRHRRQPPVLPRGRRPVLQRRRWPRWGGRAGDRRETANGAGSSSRSRSATICHRPRR